MCCPALPPRRRGRNSGGVLTLQVPETRPPLIGLTAPYDPDPGLPDPGLPGPAASQPELFDTGPDPAPIPAGQGRAAALATAGRSCTGALVDVLTGRRSAQQLARWTTEAVLADLVMLARSARRHPVRPANPYLQVVAGQAVEIVIPLLPMVGDWAPLRVLTARVEPFAGRWRCSHLGWIAAPHRPGGRAG